MKNKTKKKILGYAIIGIYTLLIVVFFISIRSKESPIKINQNFPHITGFPKEPINGIPGLFEEKGGDVEKLSSKSVDFIVPTIQADDLVEKLRKNLPYEGDGFNVTYNYPTKEVVLTIKTKDVERVYGDFDVFLKGNGVENRSLLKRFVVRFDPPQPKPTPTPITTP